MLLEEVGILRMLKRARGLVATRPTGVSLENQLSGMLKNSEDAWEVLSRAHEVSGDSRLVGFIDRLNYVIGFMDSAQDNKDYDEYSIDEFSSYLKDLESDIGYYYDGLRG